MKKFNLFLPDLNVVEKSVSLRELRERLLQSLLSSASIIGIALYIIGVAPFFSGKLSLSYPFVYTIIFSGLLAITYIKVLSSYTIRAISLLSFLYIMGVLNLFLGGLKAGASLFFLTYIAIFTLFVGIRGGVFALASTMITVAIMGVAITQGYITVGWSYFPRDVSPWFISGLTMILMGILLAISISTLIRSLDQQLRKAISLANDLSLAYEATKRENVYRYQMRHLGDSLQGETSLQTRLEDGLKLLCQILNATGGFIATRQSDLLAVRVSYQSIPPGEQFNLIAITSEDIYKPADEFAGTLAWMAPAFKDGEQLALIGIGCRKDNSDYSANDLDLLAEAADKVASIVALAEIYSREINHKKSLQSESNELFATLDTNPDPKFLKMVEDALRKLSDTVTLGHSPLSRELKIIGETHIDRGKTLRDELVNGINALRPKGIRPSESIPHEWENYIVLNDAYMEGTANRDIMARLFISESTFNRIRRRALRGVARYLLEKNNH